MYLVVLAIAVLMFWIARNLLDSRTGRAMMAIRDHTMAASTMGVNVAHYKTVVFGISALYTGVAGALHAIIFEFVAPDSFRFELSIAILVGAIIGGIACARGRGRRRVRAGVNADALARRSRSPCICRSAGTVDHLRLA
jgi:branched-chain amino acid transport system permease protein